MLKLILGFCVSMVFFVGLNAQNPAFENQKAQVSKANLLGKSIPLRDAISPIIDITNNKKASKLAKKEIPNFVGNIPMVENNKANALPKGKDPLIQTKVRGGGEPVEFIVNIDGINQNEANVLPPDPSGDIGTQYYIQTTNMSGGTVYKVFDKEGNLAQNISNLNSLWTQFGKVGYGDPIILYDQEADRWMFTEFAQFGTNTLLIAVSETSDPLGSYYAYEFITPNFPDYPKYGVWGNGYYATTNEPGENVVPVYVLDRQAMLSGASSATMVRLTELDKFNASDPALFQVATPADWDGQLAPPDNAPHYSVRIYDDAWEGGVDKLEIWKSFVDFENPNDAYMEGPVEIPLAPFESSLCQTSIFDCLDQVGGAPLSALQQVIMRRVQYRNFGSHETMVLDFSVDVNPALNQAGVRWVELRKYPSQEWELYQEGTWAPDSLNRFMGTIAMDGKGNIAMGYSVGDGDTYLGLRVTGRCDGDPLGEMTVPETEVTPGFGANPNSRWGDYSSMNVDPIDESTFWFTGEYMAANNWSTKIAAFQLTRDSIDIGPYTLDSPQNGPDLGDMETVQVQYRNYGLTPQANFNLGLYLDDKFIVSDLIADTLYPDELKVHVFSQTIDMSEIGNYEFKIYTELTNDENVFNDTLRVQRVKEPHYDISILSIDGINELLCEDSLDIDITVQNLGFQTIQNFKFNYQVNAEDIVSFLVEQEIATDEAVIVPIQIKNLGNGLNTLKTFVEEPNGEIDQVPLNDEREESFSYLENAERLSLELTTDLFGFETSWEFWDENGEVILTGGPYDFGGIKFTEEWCLEPACYSFFLYDTGGDGWANPNNDLGIPRYYIRGENDIIIALLQTQNFGFVEEVEFCLPYKCELEVVTNFEEISAEGEMDGIIALQAINALPPIQYSIDGGENYQSSPVFGGLSEGEYLISILDERGCEARDTFFLPGFSDVEEFLDAPEIEIVPNPTNGYFHVNLYGLSDMDNINVQIINAAGVIIKERRLSNYNGILTGQLSLFGEPNGIYYLRFNDNRIQQLKQIVKQ